MASTFAWLDHSESDRRKALDVVDLFGEQGTRDELGIGTVRDALADSLFPGISTIQTRAKYLLIIPWIYQALEAGRTKSSDVARLLLFFYNVVFRYKKSAALSKTNLTILALNSFSPNAYTGLTHNDQ
ncbi:MAG: hypothetical protein C0631_12735 [Sedimenticola sp.]|nr:MAG: hypothetical protein C0631_12735 [Sedimenticola sp.]